MLKESIPNASYLATAPGRVNLLGEHVDYNDGAVLPVAIDRCVRLSAAPRSDRLVTIKALDLQQETTFNLDQLDNKKDAKGNDLPSWARYPAGIAWVLQNHGKKVHGIDAAFTSNIPIGSGLSSSAAVEVSFAALWQTLGGWSADRMTLARYCQEAENKYVGVNCGLMDQFASAHGTAGHALYFDTRSLNWRPVPLPAGTVVIVADTTVRHALQAGSAYNERRAACEKSVSLLKAYLPEIRALRDVTPMAFNVYAHLLPEDIRKRARHVVEECARVDQAIALLDAGNVEEFGRLMFAGHASMRDLYEASCPELDVMVETAKKLPGCLGARLTGAGFGGCTVNLVREDKADAFIQGLKDGYQKITGLKAEVYLCHASQGAKVEKI